MKKLLTALLGAALLIGTVTVSVAQEPDKKESKKKKGKKKKGGEDEKKSPHGV